MSATKNHSLKFCFHCHYMKRLSLQFFILRKKKLKNSPPKMILNRLILKFVPFYCHLKQCSCFQSTQHQQVHQRSAICDQESVMTKKKKHGKKLSTRNDDNILGRSAMIETFARAAPFFNKTMLCTCNKKSQSLVQSIAVVASKLRQHVAMGKWKMEH